MGEASGAFLQNSKNLKILRIYTEPNLRYNKGNI
jgi:hypothetical protein